MNIRAENHTVIDPNHATLVGTAVGEVVLSRKHSGRRLCPRPSRPVPGALVSELRSTHTDTQAMPRRRRKVRVARFVLLTRRVSFLIGPGFLDASSP